MNDNKRNYLMFFSSAILYTNAMTLLSINAVITYFLAHLGASTFEIGLANALVAIGAFASQPIFAKMAMNLPHKVKTFTKILFTQRIFFLLFVLTIPLFANSSPQVLVIIFLISWAIFNFFTGSYNPFYLSLFAKMIANEQRGRLRGFSGGIGNFLALGTAFATGLLLKEVAFPYNYTIIFALGVLLLIAEVFCFVFMKETPGVVTQVNLNYLQYFKSIPTMLRENRSFKRIVFSFSFMVISQVGLVYYVLYAVRTFDINASAIALFAAIMGLVNIIGNVMFGIVADRYSHRFVLILSAACGGLAGIFILAVPQLWTVYVAFGLSNLCLSGYNLSGGMLIIDSVTREKLPMSASVMVLITLVVSSVVMLGSSVVVDHVSFAAVFAIACVAGWISCIMLARMR